MAQSISGNPYMDESAPLAARRPTTEELEEALAKKMAQGYSAFSDNPALDESYNPPPTSKAGPLSPDATPKHRGYEYKAQPKMDELPPTRRELNVQSLPEFKDVPGNVGFGPKGNIFASSKEQLEDYRRMYGGHGSENAAAAQQLRDMGREGMVMRRARQRIEDQRNPAYGGYEDEKPAFDLRQLFGK